MMLHEFLCVFLITSTVYADKKYPHIITILADDLGWNDVGFHGSGQIKTPNIDALAYNGIILNRHYVQPLCTPSRAALLTGKYPIHTGMQHSVILEPEPRGLPLTEKILPQYLKNVGYSTHAVGKWHLGYYRKEYTPTMRGFDSHYGYWNGFQDYYNQSVKATFGTMMIGLDMRRNMKVDYESVGKYSTYLYTDEAVRLIKEHDDTKPMFLYLSHLAPHAGNTGRDYQAPDEEIVKYAHISDPERRVYAAMVSILDEGVGKVVSALRHKGMLDNAIILFISDNGAPTYGVHANKGSNYPLRGQKDGPWEGGSRGVAAIWSPLLKSMKRVSNQLIHVSDWLPTLWSAIGRDVNELGKIDGLNVWDALNDNTKSPRTNMVVNIDPLVPYAALQYKDWKYVSGETSNGDYSGWFGESGAADMYDVADVFHSNAGAAIFGYVTEKQIENKSLTLEPLSVGEITSLRDAATVKCNGKPTEPQCNPRVAPCIFNINEDPCEQRNLAAAKPEVLSTFESLLKKFNETSVEPSNQKLDECANPIFFDGVWVHWQDYKPVRDVFEHLSPTALISLKIIFGLVIVIIVAAVGFQLRKKCNRRLIPYHLPRRRNSLSSVDGRDHAKEDIAVSSVQTFSTAIKTVKKI